MADDNQHYPAKIRHIFKNSLGQIMAQVHFDGYNTDDDEETPITRLKLDPSKKKAKAKPSERSMLILLFVSMYIKTYFYWY